MSSTAAESRTPRATTCSATRLEACGERDAFDRRADVLDEDRDTAERPVRRAVGGRARLLVERDDHGAEPGVVAFDAPDRRVDELAWRRVAALDERCLRGR